MKMKPTKGIIGLLCAALLLSLCGAGGVLWLEQSGLSQVRGRLKEREAQLQDGHRMATRREQANEALRTDRQQLRFLETSVSDAAYVPTLLKQLEDMAIRTHNKVIAVRPQGASKKPTKLQQRRDPEAQAEAGKDGDSDDKDKEKTKPEPYTPLEIQVNLIGSFKSTQAFIQELTRFPKIISVEQMELRPRTDATTLGGVNGLEVQLRVIGFVMKEAPQPAVTEAQASADFRPTLARADVPASTSQGGSR